jgi:fumarate hydratase class I
MDSYVDAVPGRRRQLRHAGQGQPVKQVTDACKAHGGFYLGSIGGPAARLAQDCITKVEVLEYPELGMEAVWKIEVQDFPAFIVVDDKGNDFFAAGTLGIIGAAYRLKEGEAKIVESIGMEPPKRVFRDARV